MKHTFVLTLILVASLSLGAQTTEDSMQIRKTALDYIEGFYMNDFNRMEKAIHPELAKRIIVKDENGNFMLSNMGSTQLIFNTRNYKKPEDKSGIPFKAEVVILDMSNNIASLKVTQNKMNFFDYLHMGKVNGEWKIINVLWARTN